MAMPCTPDVLVLCSQIRHFASAVDNVLCVNPGRMTQGTQGGTFAKLAVHPAPTSFFQTRALPGAAAGGRPGDRGAMPRARVTPTAPLRVIGRRASARGRRAHTGRNCEGVGVPDRPGRAGPRYAGPSLPPLFF